MRKALPEAKKKKQLRWLCLVGAFLGVWILFSSCGDTAGKADLCKVLFSPYSAEMEFVFDKNGESVCGTARLTRGDTVRLDILSPDQFSGISAEMGANDRAELISLSYSGIKAELPKNALDKLDLILSLFAESTAACVEKTPKKAFEPCEEVYAVDGLTQIKPYQAAFSNGNVQILLVYDSLSGTPLDICAQTDGSAVEVKMKKFKGAA